MTSSGLRVTVAVTAPFTIVFDVPNAANFSGTWDELPKTTVTANSRETLRTVLGRAADQIGIAVGAEALEVERRLAEYDGVAAVKRTVAERLVFVGFRQRDDDVSDEFDGVDIRRRDRRLRRIVLVVRDRDGHAVWRRPGLDATYAELLDARDAGLLEGDPLQPYLIPTVPQGDLGAVGLWSDFLEGLKVLWQATDAAARVGGAIGLVEVVRRVRARRDPRVVETVARRAPDWSARGGGPGDVLALLRIAPRSSREISALLGCSLGEAEDVLESFGYVHDAPDDHWHYRGDESAVLLADDLDLSLSVYLQGEAGRRALGAFASDRLRSLAARGTAPPVEETEREVLRRVRADADIDIDWDWPAHRSDTN